MITVGGIVWLWIAILVAMASGLSGFVVWIPFVIIGFVIVSAGVKYLAGRSPGLSIALPLLLITIATLTGLFAILFSTHGYFGGTDYSYGGYHGDYMFMGLQIFALQMSIIRGITGFYSLGFTTSSLPKSGAIT